MAQTKKARESHFGTVKQDHMDLLWAVAVILVVLWLVGMVSSYTLGEFVPRFGIRNISCEPDF